MTDEERQLCVDIRTAYIDSKHRHEMLVEKLKRYSELKALKEIQSKSVKTRSSV